jgi:hypothetical protein
MHFTLSQFAIVVILVISGLGINKAVGYEGEGMDEPDPKWVGIWSLTSIATYSTCDTAVVGDKRVSRLMISIERGTFKAIEDTGQRKIVYSGTRNEDSSFAYFLLANVGEGQAGIQIRPNGSGRRVVVNSGSPPCAIIYDAKAKRER